MPYSSMDAPETRLGPRPLPLHLMTVAAIYVTSNAALPLLRSGSLRWSQSLDAAALQESLASVKPEAFAAAVEAEARRRLGAFLTGVERYRRHPYRRQAESGAAVWSSGTTTLYDFGESGKDGGRPLLLVPSLVNRAYILDLLPQRSFCRWLARNGFRPFLLDWDAPGPQERQFDLSDYVIGRLDSALDAVLDSTGERPALVGYCMGGLLALALAQRRSECVSGLALLATPWDFHAGRRMQAQAIAGVAVALHGLTTMTGELPVDIIQTLFAGLDPVLAERKFVGFAALDPDSDKASEFVALEDWLNDGVPLAAPVAQECLAGWYGENTPATGRWRIGGAPIEPPAIDIPSLSVIPANDRIVPPDSALALSAALPRSEILRPNAGHVGMIVSRGVERTLWPEIAGWLAGLS